MERKVRLGTTIFIGIACAIIASVSTYFVLNNIMTENGKLQQTHQKILSKLITADDKLRQNFIGKLDDDKVIDGILQGYMYATGDRYAAYYDKKALREIEQDQKGEYEGIGLNVSFDSAKAAILVTNVLKNSPSEKQGIKINDLIVKVGSENVSDLGYDVAVKKIKGAVGTKAEFTVLRDGKEIKFSVPREKFDRVTVEQPIILNDNIGFIKITEFDEKTPDEFKKQVELAISQGAKSLVFDVRNNPGGLLDSVVKVLDYLLPKGEIVTLQYKEGLVDEKGKKVEPAVYYSDEKEINLPMVVLINGNTASAGELFTAALRDYGKAKLVGEKTFGKGVGQNTFPLGDETAIKFTTFTYKPPKGANYDGVGLMPDFPLALTPEQTKNFYLLQPQDDIQVKKAVEILTK